MPPITGVESGEKELLEQQTGNVMADLLDGKVPLGGTSAGGVWSLLSLILSLVSLVFTAVWGIGVLRRRGQQEKRQPMVPLIASAFAGVLAPVLWLVLDNLRTPAAWVNQYTLLIALLVVLAAVLKLLAKAMAKAQQAAE